MQNLSSNDVYELHDDIENYLSLEQSEINIDFWTVRAFGMVLRPNSTDISQNMMVVCKDRIDGIEARERQGRQAAAAVEDDISRLLAGKSYEHLVTLQKQVQGKLSSGEPVDTDYWEGLLKKLLVWKAKVML